MSMTFSRKKSINKKPLLKDSNEDSLMNTTKSSQLSLQPSSSRISSSRKINFQQSLENIQSMHQELQNHPIQSLDSKISQILRNIFDGNKSGVLISQKLSLYREMTFLMARYRQLCKKNARPFDQTSSNLSLSAYRNIIEQCNQITKQQRNDELVLEANMIPSVFSILDAFVGDIEELQTVSNERRPLMMRKHSLKKVTQGTVSSIGRPKSRGKLNSLSKKQKSSMVSQILELKSSIKKQRPESREVENNECGMSLIEEIAFYICCTLKNLSANKKIRRDILKEEYLRLINRYLLIWNEKSLSPFGSTMLIQLTSASRHLAAQEKSYRLFLKSNCFEPWTKLIEMFPTSNDLIFNLLRILSKLSAYQQCCEKLNEKKGCIKTLSSFLKAYKAHIHIVIRVSFIFANMTSYLHNIRTQLYFQLSAWDDIYICFEHYANSELKGKSQIDKMGISMAAWDYKTIKKQSDIEALMKIIRLIANIFTVPQIGQDIYREHSQQFRDLVKQLKLLLATKTNIEKYNQLIACVLSCLTNILYYDRETLLANNEYKTIKKQLIDVLVDFVVQIDNEEVCCESLRVVSNITRMKHFIKHVIDAKIHEGILILLDSTSKEIVYYSLGIIINLLGDDDFKQEYRSAIVGSLVSILNQCQNQDFDIVTVALKALSIVMEGKTSAINPNQLTELENCLVNLGSHCDKAMLGELDDRSQLQSAQESRNLINLLLNNMPQEKFTCPVKNCGRKFAQQKKLDEHINRRHKVS